MNTVPPLVDRIVFHSRHWQLFALMLIGIVAFESLWSEVTYFFLIIQLMWIPLIGFRLKRFLPKHYSTHYKIFTAVWIASFLSLIFTSFMHVMPEVTDFILFNLVGIFWLTMLSFVARGIKSLQTNDRATVNDYFVDIFLLWFYFPIGVWIIQPRLNLLGYQYFRD